MMTTTRMWLLHPSREGTMRKHGLDILSRVTHFPTSSLSSVATQYQFDKSLYDDVESKTITDHYSIGDAPNGGYLMAKAMVAAREVTTMRDPLTITAHFVAKADEHQHVDWTVELVHRSRSMENVAIGMYQNGGKKAVFLAAFGDFARMKGPTYKRRKAPILPPVSECIEAGPIIKEKFLSPLRIENQYNFVLPKNSPFYTTTLSGRSNIDAAAEYSGYVRFRDKRPHCYMSLSLFLDALPPPALNVCMSPWVPTLEFTSHFWGLPITTSEKGGADNDANWLKFRFKTEYMINGLLCEEGELWDYTEEKLLATSKQVARLLLPR